MTPGLGMHFFFSRWLPGGQVGHIVWGLMGSPGTHVPPDMQIYSYRHADISIAYIWHMPICRYGLIYLDSKMALMTWHVPVDPRWCPTWPRVGSKETPFLKFFKWIFIKITPSFICWSWSCTNVRKFSRKVSHFDPALGQVGQHMGSTGKCQVMNPILESK